MNVVWDLGAVLLHWRPADLLARLLPRHIADAADAARWSEAFFQLGGDWHAFDRGTVTVAELVGRISVRTGLRAEQVQAVVDAVPAELQPIDGSVALLHALHAAGHRQYYLSNMPAPYARHLEISHTFFGRFSGGLFSSSVQLIKPEPEIFTLAQRRFGLADDQPTLFIDDLPANVAAARASGWHGVHFTDPLALATQLKALGLL